MQQQQCVLWSKGTCHEWSVDMPRLEFDLEHDLSKKRTHPVWILLTRVSQPLIPFTRYWIHYWNATVFCTRMWWGWNYNGQGHEREPAVQGETAVPETLSTTNPTRTGLGRKPCLRVKKRAITPPPPRGVWKYLKKRSGIQGGSGKGF